MVCRDFILPEPASYVFFYAVFNLRNLLYIILGFRHNRENIAVEMHRAALVFVVREHLAHGLLHALSGA